MFIGLLSFSGSLARKCMLLNNEQSKTRRFLIGLNPFELRHYHCMIINAVKVVIHLAAFVSQAKQKI